MTEDLIIKEVTSCYKRFIKQSIDYSMQVDIEDMVEDALKDILTKTLSVPEDGYFGTIGVHKEIPIRKSDLELFRPKIREVLNDTLMKAQSDKLIKTIGTTSALSLIKGVFEGSEEKYLYGYHDSSDKIVLRVDIDPSHYITLAVHLSSNMLKDIDNIMPAIKKAKEMIKEYGSDFSLQRN